MIPYIGPSTEPKMPTKTVIACGLETKSQGQTSTERMEVIRPPILKLIFSG